MTLQPNTTLQQGRYRIISILGQGGFGITYLAEQVMAERQVCIKEFFPKDFYNRDSSTNSVLLGTQGSAEYMERYKEKFVKEAKTIAKFDHPNIIHIFDVFEENNTCYYVMEYIDGESLHDRVKRCGAMDEVDALRYIREAGAALAHIHSNSVNHLDIKPSNIMIRHSDDRAILIDFGVSKHYDKDGSQTSTTPVGLSHGFAPMEQYRESGVSSFSPETDIYSLGATLYSILTATIPPMASDVAEDGLPDFPEHLETATCRAIECSMEMRRKDRPHSVEEFFTLLDGGVISPRSETPKAAPVSAPKAAPAPASEETVVAAPQAESPKAAPAPAPASDETVITSPNGGATPPPASAQPKKEWVPRYAVDNKGGNSKESKPKKSSKVGLIVSILIGLLLIGGGVFFLMSANNSDNSSDATDDYNYNYDNYNNYEAEPNYDYNSNNGYVEDNVVDTYDYAEVEAAVGDDYYADSEPAAEAHITYDPVLVLDTNDDIEVPYDACGVYIPYTLENPISGVSLYVTDDVYWGSVSQSYDAIDFYAEANDSVNPRTATLTITYGSIVQYVYITQEGKPDLTRGDRNGYEWVDLGLPSGIKWATCNVGASRPEVYGYYFAWGETWMRSNYTQKDCTTYNANIYDISNNTTYDVASSMLGYGWRMPTKAEFEELLTHCTWSRVEQNGTLGYIVTGYNGNSIFLPSAGYYDGKNLSFYMTSAHYWTSTPFTNSSTTSYALKMYDSYATPRVEGFPRYYGLPVRAVMFY